MFNIVWSNGLGSDQCVLLLQDYLCQDMIKIAQPGHAGAVPTPPPGRVLASLYLHMPYRELSTIC